MTDVLAAPMRNDNPQAPLATEQEAREVAEAYVDDCIEAHAEGRLSAVDAAKAKWWSAQVQNDVLDECVQLHGGYGFMQEYDIQLHYRRAKGWPLVLASPASECARLAARRYGSLEPVGAR